MWNQREGTILLNGPGHKARPAAVYRGEVPGFLAGQIHTYRRHQEVDITSDKRGLRGQVNHC